MARVVVRKDKGPLELKIGEKSKWICQCGLSRNFPYCDGSHKKTADEHPDKLYRYHEDGTREVVE